MTDSVRRKPGVGCFKLSPVETITVETITVKIYFFQTLADIFQWPLICADEPVTQGNLWQRGVQYGPVMFTYLCLYLEIVSTNMSLFQSQEFVTQWQPNAEMLLTSLVRPQSALKVEIWAFILPRNFPADLIIFTGRGGAGNPPPSPSPRGRASIPVFYI